MQFVGKMKEHFLENMLHGIRQIHVAMRDLSVRLRRSTEELLHLVGEMPRQPHRSVGQNLHALAAAKRFEVTHVQLKAAILQRDNLLNLLHVCIFAVWSQAHDLAFIAILPVSDEVANHGVKAAKRVREKNAVEYLNFDAPRTAPSSWKQNLPSRHS